MPAVQTARQDSNPPTFETVWAALQETDRIVKENAQEMTKLRESQKETARIVRENAQQMKESQKETDRKMQETAQQMKESAERLDKQLGKLGNRMGEIVEHMVAPNLREKFRELGYDFPKANPNSDVSDRKNSIHIEIDVMLENGDKAMLVEVKTKPTTEDVKEHIKRLEKMRVYADLRGDKRTFLGAVAGVVMTDNVKEYALKQGFFVIEPSGETFTIILPHNKPKEW